MASVVAVQVSFSSSLSVTGSPAMARYDRVGQDAETVVESASSLVAGLTMRVVGSVTFSDVVVLVNVSERPRRSLSSPPCR